MCAFVVLGLVFPYQAKTLAWGTSTKWPILCRVGCKTLTRSINQPDCWEKQCCFVYDSCLMPVAITILHYRNVHGVKWRCCVVDLPVLIGRDIEAVHCIIHYDAGNVTLTPAAGAACYINNVQITQPTKLNQGESHCTLKLKFYFHDTRNMLMIRLPTNYFTFW